MARVVAVAVPAFPRVARSRPGQRVGRATVTLPEAAALAAKLPERPAALELTAALDSCAALAAAAAARIPGPGPAATEAMADFRVVVVVVRGPAGLGLAELAGREGRGGSQ
jgi:hypothetical protein